MVAVFDLVPVVRNPLNQVGKGHRILRFFEDLTVSAESSLEVVDVLLCFAFGVE